MKTLALVLLMGCCLNSYAQKTRIQGGINLANVTVTNDGRVDRSNTLNSFQIGIIGDLRLGGPLYLQPGLLYTGKGAKVENGTEGTDGYFRQTFNPFYLEVPVNLVFKAPIGNNNSIFVGAGPYLGVGIRGKVTTEGQALGLSYTNERNIRFSNDDPTTLGTEEGTGLGVVRRFDYGVNGTAGIDGKSIVLSVNYGLGLAKLQSGADDNANDNNKNRVLSFTLGFKF